MDTKQIAEIVGTSRDSVCYWIKKVLPEVHMGKGVKVDLTEAQFVTLIKAIPKKNIITGGTQNAVRGTQSAVTSESETIKAMGAMVQELCGTVRDVLKAITPAQAPAQIEAPKMTDRATLRQLVAVYAKQEEIDYPKVWAILYNEALYRLEINIPLRAKNRGIKPIEIAEEEGLLPELIAIAREVLK